MVKHRFVAWVALGLLFGPNAFSQSKISSAQNLCNARAAAYQAAQDKCSDFNSQLVALKSQIEAHRQARALLESQCYEQKIRAACEHLGGLSDGHLAALEQQYYGMASVGCMQSGITPKEAAETCASEGITPASAPNKTAPISNGKTPAQNTNKLAQATPPDSRTADRSSSNPSSRMQQVPPTSTGASGGIGFGRQSNFGGPSGGQVSPPPSTSATGAGRVK